jgi:hypothetical protein
MVGCIVGCAMRLEWACGIGVDCDSAYEGVRDCVFDGRLLSGVRAGPEKDWRV